MTTIQKLASTNLGLDISLLIIITVVGTGSFTGQPKDGKIEVAIGHLKNLKAKELLRSSVSNLLQSQKQPTRQ